MNIFKIKRDELLLDLNGNSKELISDDIDFLLKQCPLKLQVFACKNKIFLDRSYATYYRRDGSLKITYTHEIRSDVCYSPFDLRNIMLNIEQYDKYFKDITLKSIEIDSWVIPTINITVKR